MPARVPHPVRLFVGNTSLRGFAKLARADQRPFLRLLWTSFVVSMFCILIISCYLLISEYFQYHVSSQTDQLVKETNPFPSVTICSHQPFSQRAHHLWASGAAPSPANFSRRIRHAMRNLVAIGQYRDALEVFQFDRLTGYYQNLEHHQISSLGHRKSDLLLFCVMRHSHNTNPSVAHEDQCLFSVRQIMHPLYFNCYTLEVKNEPEYVSSVSMVISGGGQIMHGHSNQVYNLFDQAVGLVIVLHEPGTYPDTDAEQYKVELGTANTIRYTTKKFVLHRTPKTDCKYDNEPGPTITQNDESYFHYTQSACISQQISNFINYHCNCTSAFHLNSRPLTNASPFCSQLEDDGLAGVTKTLKRVTCARKINLGSVYKDQSNDAAGCKQRCTHYRYSVEQSNSDWRPLGHQLRWMKNVTQALSSNATNLTAEQAATLNQFFTEGDADNNWANVQPPSDKDMAMVTVVRETFVTQQQSEKLVISLSALISRLGGVGTLTLGVTLTVAFEFVELVYLLLTEALCGGGGRNRRGEGDGDGDMDDDNNDADGGGRRRREAEELMNAIKMEGLAVRVVTVDGTAVAALGGGSAKLDPA